VRASNVTSSSGPGGRRTARHGRADASSVDVVAPPATTIPPRPRRAPTGPTGNDHSTTSPQGSPSPWGKPVGLLRSWVLDGVWAFGENVAYLIVVGS